MNSMSEEIPEYLPTKFFRKIGDSFSFGSYEVLADTVIVVYDIENVETYKKLKVTAIANSLVTALNEKGFVSKLDDLSIGFPTVKSEKGQADYEIELYHEDPTAAPGIRVEMQSGPWLPSFHMSDFSEYLQTVENILAKTKIG